MDSIIAASTPLATKPRAPRKVLLVEDDPNWQIMIGGVLRTIDQNLHLSCVSSVEKARHLLVGASPFDLVISDYTLEGKSTGLDLMLSCQEAYRQIPFIFVSGIQRSEFSDFARGHRMVMPHFWPKSLQMADLKLALADHLERGVLALPRSLQNPFNPGKRFGWAELAFLATATSMLVSRSFNPPELRIDHLQPTLLKSKPPLVHRKLERMTATKKSAHITTLSDLLSDANNTVAKIRGLSEGDFKFRTNK